MWRALALRDKIGGQEKLEEILSDEYEVNLVKKVRKLFDKNGRRIPDNVSASVCNPDRDFHLIQPKLNAESDYANRMLRLRDYFADTGVSAKPFKAETEDLLAMIKDDVRISNIAGGVGLPVIMPKMANDDLGTELGFYLAGVENNYTKTFSDRKFNNHCKGTLAGNVEIVEGSRHNRLVSRMKKGPVVGIYFPNPLQGFSVLTQREQMAALPENFILSGLDVPIAMMMYPDVLARDRNTPGLDLPAFSWQSAGRSLGFEADDDGLDFNDDGYLGGACGGCSGGLFLFR